MTRVVPSREQRDGTCRTDDGIRKGIVRPPAPSAPT